MVWSILMWIVKTSILLLVLLYSSLSYGAPATPAPASEIILQLKWSPDGTQVATSTLSGQVWLWDGETNKSFIQHPGGITDLTWSPDSKRILTGGWDSTVRVWDIQTEKALATLSVRPDPITSVNWSLDGKYIAAAIGGVDGATVIWDAETYKIISGAASDAYQSVFSPDGTKIALGKVFGIGLYDVSTGDYLFNLPENLGSRQDIIKMNWTPDGNMIAGLQADNTIRIWDVTNRQLKFTFEIPAFSQALYIDPEGKILSLMRLDGYLTTWDLTTGKQIEDVPVVTGEIAAAAFSPCGGQIAYALKSSADVKIVFPAPSLERLTRIASTCAAGRASSAADMLKLLSADAMSKLTEADLSAFVDQLEALPPNAIPAACAADLIAVAQTVMQF